MTRRQAHSTRMVSVRMLGCEQQKSSFLLDCIRCLVSAELTVGRPGTRDQPPKHVTNGMGFTEGSMALISDANTTNNRILN